MIIYDANTGKEKDSVTKTVLMATVFLFTALSCNLSSEDSQQYSTGSDDSAIKITEQEVVDAQKAWGEGIVNIGKIYLEDGDYKTAASRHIKTLYNYQEGSVLFKPTLASEDQFRTDFEGALSYFVGGDERYAEDHGFAINPWSSVCWENTGIKIIGNMALAMGNYYFNPVESGDEVKVEYSFAYTKNEDGELKIILHGSHLPYSPQEEH